MRSYLPFEQLLAESDFVSIHCPLNGVVTTGQERHRRPGSDRTIEHDVRESAAGVNRNHQVFGSDGHGYEVLDAAFDTAFESGPTRHQHVREGVRARNPLGVDGDGALTRRIEQQEQVRDEGVPRGEFDHATTANPAPHAARNLPGLEELLARKALGLADRTGDAGKESLARKPAQVAMGEQRAAAGVEVHRDVTTRSQYALQDPYLKGAFNGSPRQPGRHLSRGGRSRG